MGMNLQQAIESVRPTCEASVDAAAANWDNIAKPLNSLGLLETTVNRLAGIERNAQVDISKRCLVIMCADNGVVAQGVTQTDSVVTTIMSENFAKGTTTVCTMAQHIGVNVLPINIGINNPTTAEGLVNRNVMMGTNDITQGPAMTMEQALQAIEVGIDIALSLKTEGYKLIATGEMGIGNTTTSSCLATLLLNQKIEDVTGRGAGLDMSGFDRKIGAIRKAILVNNPNKDDVIDALAKVGGLDIAGMVGLYIGGAAVQLPVMIDGFISGISAVIAARLCPLCKEYMIVSHVSAEPAGQMVLDELGFKPLVTAGMCLGEGTGAMAALALIDMAIDIYYNTITFAKINMDEYIHFK